MREDDKLKLVGRGAWCHVESRNLTYDYQYLTSIVIACFLVG